MTKEDILHHFQDINFRYNDCMMYDDLSRMLDELIAENKGEWIPITERLPENDGHYLVTWVDGNYQTVDIIGFANHLCEIDEIDFGNKTYSGWYEYNPEYGHYEWNGVVAWMPLPEPYKGESEDKE